MALIIEDGSIVANANSYATVADLRTYAELRSVDVTQKADKELEALLIKAMDYLEGKNYKGDRVNSTQSLKWPRSNVWLDGYLQDSATIPRNIEYAQLALAVEAIDNDLQPNRLPSDKGQVIREKVDVIEVAYSNPHNPRDIPAFAKADALLNPLLKNNGLFLIRA